MVTSPGSWSGISGPGASCSRPSDREDHHAVA
jgi:hypothetical protein